MTDLTDRLDAIQARVDEAEAKRKRSRANPAPIFDAGMMLAIQASSADVPFLLDLARKQQAALDAVNELAEDAAAQPLTELAPVRIFAGFIRQALEAKP